jgi:hypothetical protein
MAEPGTDQDTLKEYHALGHEIRSSAQGLLGYLQIFNDETQQQLDAEQLQMLSRINFFARRLADLMLELLAKNKS